MKTSKSSPSLFEIPNIKNAEVIKTEIKPLLHIFFYDYTHPLPFENEPYSLETIPFIREHLDTYLFYIIQRLQLFLQNIHISKLPFLNKKLPQFKHIEEQLT